MFRNYLFIPLVAVLPAVCFSQPPELSWSQVWDYSEEEYAENVSPTLGNGYVMTGSTNFGPGSNSCFVILTDEDGNEIWTRMFSGDGGQYGSDGGNFIIQSRDGGFILCGGTESFSGTGTWASFTSDPATGCSADSISGFATATKQA